MFLGAEDKPIDIPGLQVKFKNFLKGLRTGLCKLFCKVLTDLSGPLGPCRVFLLLEALEVYDPMSPMSMSLQAA